nr:hypothetical protein [Tanacetum cinerariifolium]
MTMTTALDTNQTTIASTRGKLRRRSIPAIRNKKPNLLTKIVNKLFSVVFETNEEPQQVPRQRASVSTPMVTSKVLEEEIASPVELEKAYMASRPYKIGIVPHGPPIICQISFNFYPKALAADIVATSTLLGVSRTHAVVEPPQKNVFDSVTTNGHAKLTESNKPTNIFGKYESKDGKGNDQKAANVCGNLDAPASTAPTNGIFSFRTTTSSLCNFSSPHVSSTSIASTDTTTTVISTTPTPATILSTSTPTPVNPSSVLAPIFSFWSATSTTTTILEAETGNTNDKDLKSNSPFASTPISTTTTTTRSGLFGFSSPAFTSTTNNQSQASFFNVSNRSQANTQASVALTPSMPFLFGSRTTSIPSSTSRTSPFSSPASTSSSFSVSSITASNSTSGPATSIFYMVAEDTHVYGTDMSVDGMVAKDTHVHGTDMIVDGMVAEDTHVHGTDISVDGMVAEDTHAHGTDMCVDSMVAEDTHVHGTRATLNNYDHRGFTIVQF